MEFIDKEVAKKYECLAEVDMIKNTGDYSGKLTDIDVKTAAYLVATGDASIKEKVATPKAVVPKP